jgi:hypothetical protein
LFFYIPSESSARYEKSYGPADEEFYAVVLADGIIVEAQDEERI